VRYRGCNGRRTAARLLFVEDRGNHAFAVLLDIADARLRYLDPGLDNAAEPIFSPDGRQVAFIRYLDPPPGAAGDAPDGGPYWSIRIADAATGTARLLWEAPRGPGSHFMGTRSRNLFWSADGQLIFPWERTGWIHAYAIDAAKGGEPRALMSGAFEVETFLLGADNRSLIYAANAGDIDRRHIWRKPLGSGAAVALTTGQGIESFPTLAGDALGVTATDATHPAHAALIGDKGKLAPLGTAPVARGFIAPEPDSISCRRWRRSPWPVFKGRGTGKRPALIFIHGGPRRQMLLGFHPSGYYSNAYIMNQHMAAQGYDVLAVNYRSGTGYGQAFRDAPEIARAGASEYRDILAAGQWLAARDDVDPKRIGLWGGSWGGYLTALGLARDSDLFAAGVDLHGVHTMLRPLPTSLAPAVQDAARQLQWDSSPMGAIDRWKSPVLLIHGDDDRNVDFAQSPLLARELAARRIPFRQLVFPNERHSFIRYDHWLEALSAADAFLGETLMKKDMAR
jgi:dipeptidyl aminopeptidase/acylaminoacyl peptidase